MNESSTTKTQTIHRVCIYCTTDYVGLCGEQASRWPLLLDDDVEIIGCPECLAIDEAGHCLVCASLPWRVRAWRGVKAFGVDVIGEAWVRLAGRR